MFRIWYQIRSSTRQKKRFDWLIRFIELWYSMDELKKEGEKLASRYTRLMSTGQVGEAEMVKIHLTYVNEVRRKKETEIQKWHEKRENLCAEGRYDESIACCDEALRIDPQYDYAWYNKDMALINLGRHAEAIACFECAIKYTLVKPEYLQKISKDVIQFYLKQTTQSIAEKNMGTAHQLLSRIIEFKHILESHKIPEKETGFNQLLMDFIIKLLKGEKAVEVLELLDILDRSEISKYTGFLFPLRILAQYLQTKDEDILNRQRPEVKGIIREILGKM
ncbi:MAG: bacterial transcriptional activator domain-containing protein [Candidatus Desantisbacteria bacterium]